MKVLSINLGEFSKIFRGIQINKIKLVDQKPKLESNSFIYPAIHLRNVKPWLATKPFYYAIHDDNIAGKEKRELLINNKKLLIPRFVLKLKASYDEYNYVLDNIYIIIIKSNFFNTKFVCGVMNSKLLNFYYHKIHSQNHISGGYYAINGQQLKELPIIREYSNNQYDKMVSLVDRMLDLNKKVRAESISTQEKKVLEKQIEITDSEIDKLVYELYGLTEEEIRIVEGEG
ncbi:MAG: TaqI-like C-terminal specificity domain-containing protein [bacterium]